MDVFISLSAFARSTIVIFLGVDEKKNSHDGIFDVVTGTENR